jgi:hypothetical protein
MAVMYGLRNSAYYNRHPEGDERWYSSREARDLALVCMRATAVRDGLAHSASLSGIRPIYRDSSELSGVVLVDTDEIIE